MPFEPSTWAVVTPAASRDLATLAAVARECSTTVEAVTGAGDLLAAASEAVVAYTGREWVRETVAETFRGNGHTTEALLLRRTPIVSITSVTVDGTALNLATEIEHNADTGAVWRLDLDARRSWGGSVVVVTYQGGYVPPGATGANMPGLVMLATAKAAAAWFMAAGRDANLRSVTVEDVGTKTYRDAQPGDTLPPGIAPLLDMLRRRRL